MEFLEYVVEKLVILWRMACHMCSFFASELTKFLTSWNLEDMNNITNNNSSSPAVLQMVFPRLVMVYSFTDSITN